MESIINCETKKESIKQAVETLYSTDFIEILPQVKVPYDRDIVSEKILKVLRKEKIPEELKKEFCDL